MLYAQQQEPAEARPCESTQENIAKDPILTKIETSVSGGMHRGENLDFICVTENTIVRRFDNFLKTRFDEANWGWSAIDMLINQANFTLDEIVPYEFTVNQTAMKHHIAILIK